MATTRPTHGVPIASQDHQRRLEACKRAVDRGHRHYSDRVLERWFGGATYSDGIPGIELVQTSDPRVCRDCESRRRLYYWSEVLPSLICGPCSLARFEHAGRNPRQADVLSGGRR